MLKKFLDKLFNTDEVQVEEGKGLFEMDKNYEKEAIEVFQIMRINIMG